MRVLGKIVLLVVLSILFQLPAALAGSGPSSMDKLQSCDAAVAIAAAETMVNDPSTLQKPAVLFYAAQTLFRHGKKEEAVFWFYAAQLRSRYQLAFEKGDHGQVLNAMLMGVGQPINNYAFQDVSRLHRTIDRVLTWDKTAPNPYRTRTRSADTDKQIRLVYSGLRDLQARMLAEKSSMEAAARAAAPNFTRAQAQENTRLCRKEQVDPSMAAQEIEREESLAVVFVKRNPTVIHQVGSVKKASINTYTLRNGDVMPYTYDVWVRGDGDKETYAVLNVTRESGTPKFVLACVTRLSPGMRDSRKDPCKQ